MHQQLKGLLWVLLTILVALGLIYGLPMMADWVPWSFEKHAASYMETSSENVCVSTADPQGAAALKKMVARLYPLYPTDPHFPVEVDIIHGDTVNAYAGLGGHIHVFNGLLQELHTPEELAGVLAHEIEHVHHRHILQTLFVRLSTVGALQFLFSNGRGMTPLITRLLLDARFTRTQEHEADVDGLKRLQAAHISNQGFVDFFTRAQGADSFFSLVSDHPASGDRAALARSYPTPETSPVLTSAEWNSLKRSCH